MLTNVVKLSLILAISEIFRCATLKGEWELIDC